MQPGRTSTTGLGLVVAAVALLASCSGKGGSAHPGVEVVHAGTTDVVVESEPFRGSAAGVGVGGTLERVGGRCLGFHFGDEPVLLIFAHGATVTGSDAGVVIHAGGQELRLFQSFSGGSRTSSPRPLNAFDGLADQLPESCRQLEAIVFEPK
ncbi:MAG: hypothetical protein U0R78_08955 [Nocardioidaceae bacterium]